MLFKILLCVFVVCSCFNQASFATPSKNKQVDTSSCTLDIFGTTQATRTCTQGLLVVLRVVGKILTRPFDMMYTLGYATFISVNHFYYNIMAPVIFDVYFALKATWDAALNCAGKSFQEVQVEYKKPCLSALDDAARRILLVITNRSHLVLRAYDSILHLIAYFYFHIVEPLFSDITLFIKAVIGAFKTCSGISNSVKNL